MFNLRGRTNCDIPALKKDGRQRIGWSVCPIGMGKGKHEARCGFSVGQGKIGGRRGVGVTRRAGEGEGKGDGVWGLARSRHAEEEGMGGMAAGKARGRWRQWPIGRLPREAGERREEGAGPVGVGHGWAVAVGRPKGIVTFCFIQTHFNRTDMI
jgi:hypothetical protein